MTVSRAGREVESETLGVFCKGELDICCARKIHGLDHVKVCTVHGDDIAALVGCLFSCSYSGFVNHQVCLGIDVVGNRVLIINLIHITKDNRAGNRSGRHNNLELVTGLALELD